MLSALFVSICKHAHAFHWGSGGQLLMKPCQNKTKVCPRASVPQRLTARLACLLTPNPLPFPRDLPLYFFPPFHSFLLAHVLVVGLSAPCPPLLSVLSSHCFLCWVRYCRDGEQMARLPYVCVAVCCCWVRLFYCVNIQQLLQLMMVSVEEKTHQRIAVRGVQVTVFLIVEDPVSFYWNHLSCSRWDNLDKL